VLKRSQGKGKKFLKEKRGGEKSGDIEERWKITGSGEAASLDETNKKEGVRM